MGKVKDRTGEVHGDFLLTKRISGKSYEVKCVHCGFIRNFSINAICYGRMRCKCNETEKRVCRECGKEFFGSEKRLFCSQSCCSTFHNRRKKKEAGGSKRKITKTTKMLTCVYTEEGLSEKEISNILKRSESVISRILKKCKENGEYDKFILQSPVLPILKKRKRKCT